VSLDLDCKKLREIIVKHWKMSRFLILCLLVLAFAMVASAQQATIVGTITDPSGAAVPGVQITVTSTETGLVHRLVSNDAGQYVEPDINIGHYTIKAEAAGFKAAEKTDIVLQVGDRIRVDFALEIGATSESIKVEANAIAVKSDSGEVSDVITGQEVTQIATNGRSLYALALLTPGTANNTPGFQAPTAVGASSNIAFDGQRQNHNLWLADGAEQSDRGGAGGSIIAPSLDAIGEFRVLSSNYGADYGLSSAGTVTMVFKSGTKDLHASAWEFVRNNDFDANDFFRNQSTNLQTSSNPAELRLNTYGFNVGGPVTFGKLYNKNRDKTFFFYNMEWRKLIQQGGQNQQVPPTSAYGGNLSYLLPAVQLTVPNASQINPTEVAKFAAAGLLPGAPIPGNIIPSSLINPASTALLSDGIFPGPTGANNHFIGGNNNPTDVREELVRIDHQFSDKFWVFGHYVAEAVSQTYGTPTWQGTNIPTVGSTFGNPAYTAVIHATYAISPTLLSETAFNYDGNRISILPIGTTTGSARALIPELFPSDPGGRLPGISLTGNTGTNYDVGPFPWLNRCDDYQVRQDVSWTKGAHQFKMGASWAIYKKNQALFGDTQGQFQFNGGFTGNDFADFLLGYAHQYTELAAQDAGQWNAVSPAAYVQDNWRVNSRLTVNLGLRWDGIPHTYEANHRMSNFYPEQYNPANAALLSADGSTILPTSPGLGTSPNAALAAFKFYLNGVGITGLNGNPNGMVDNHWLNFGPRVGFAYDLTGKGRTVVRGGFGTMYERIQGNDMYNSGSNPPFSASVTNFGVSLTSPGTSLASGTTVASPIGVAGLTALSENNYKTPVTYQFSLGVEQQFGRNSVFSASYVGNQSRHQFDYQDINLPPQALLPNILGAKGTYPVAYNTVLPYRGFGSINMGENGENAHYNGLQTSVHSQWSKDLSVQASYTFSKAMDPAESFGGDNTNVYNPYNLGYDWGPSQVDVRHIAVFSFVYDLPIFRNTGNRFAKTVIGGWEVAGLWTFQTGLPLQITLGGADGSNGLAIGTNRPNFTGTVDYPQTPEQWFTTTGFSAPAPGSWGTLTKGAIRGPGRNNWNVSMFKSFLISEARGSHLEFRAESFNTFNHTQFNGVNTSFTGGNFGAVNSAWDPRELQLAAKIIF
jgi:Carboxypeptidase regulatory-like domain